MVKTLKYEVREQVAWVTLSRPKVMNAINTELHNAIAEAFIEISRDNNILVVIITGEGGKAFSTGDDLKELSKQDVHRLGALSYVEQVDECPQPIIAAIDGYCLGGGFELALRCDILIATKKSRFGFPEPRMGIFAPYGLHRLPRVIPLREALRILLTGDHMNAQRAYDIGLVQALVPDRNSLFAEAQYIADEIKLCSPLVAQATKRIVREGQSLSLEESIRLSQPIIEQIQNSEDRLKGARAFVENRSPDG